MIYAGVLRNAILKFRRKIRSVFRAQIPFRFVRKRWHFIETPIFIGAGRTQFVSRNRKNENRSRRGGWGETNFRDRFSCVCQCEIYGARANNALQCRWARVLDDSKLDSMVFVYFFIFGSEMIDIWEKKYKYFRCTKNKYDTLCLYYF